MNSQSFEMEFEEFLKKNDTPIKKFIMERYTSNSSRVFFERFLLTYGVYAFNSFQSQFNQGYIPFINCKENNIFGLKGGITDLSTKPLSLNESEAEIARFLIKQFKSIPVKKFQNWSKDQL